MYAQKLEAIPPPPGVIGSLKAGFDVVSSHVFLILIPLFLDLFLWLGPRLSVSGLLSPVYQMVFNQVRRGLTSPDEVKQLVVFQDLFNEGLQRFNLVSLMARLQTFPIGISSLLAKTMPVDNPTGSQNLTQMSSPFGMIGAIFLLILIGWVIAALYFRWVSGTALGQRELDVSISRAVLQTLLLSVIWLMFLFVISVPIMILLTILTFISPALASAALFVLALIAFWLIVPLFFTPHGIFVRRQNAFYSIFSSFRMARFTLPSSALFVFITFILSTGLNYLWSVPESDSWMTLIGIAGHAFITTALLAASFVYYRDMNGWLQLVLERLHQKNTLPARRV
ncbi:MAG TPA: hypothetical protein VJ785_05855 [Anaerolineales bacterium]|nr:hypothetical protein [Anaerolineales bacterium]